MTLASKGPFPFKGKGGDHWNIPTLRDQLETLQQQRELTLRQMKALINEYEAAFGNQLQAYLVMHKTANGQYLRWRMSGIKQRYFAIADDEIGQTFLSSHSPTVMKVLSEIEETRLRLNYLHGVYFYEIKTTKKLISQLLALNEQSRATAC
ncbi:MAG: hypothetical protein ABW158_06085 [Candidatus Thiodiazotropha sp. 6PDIVS]